LLKDFKYKKELYALFDVGSPKLKHDLEKKWRCYSKDSLKSDKSQYDLG